MNQPQYGFQKLVLLNSAGYSRAELPLDDSVSIIAPNNTGKTSLINALQFLLILDRGRMDFGAHSVESSRRFYFPDNSAYILLEVFLPTGMAVIGCVGKGLSHDYEYFAYAGSLNVDDYRLPDGSLLTQPKLLARLYECGYVAKIYPQADLRALLYGNRQKQRADEPDLTLFPLEFSSQAPTYQRILTKTLRLDRLNSGEVKNYLLDIFKNELQNSKVDFKSEWDKSFADVNYDKSQYDAVFRNRALIAVMAENQQARLSLRGKILLWRPVLDQHLQAWEAYYRETGQGYNQTVAGLDRELAALETRQKTIYKDLADTRQIVDKLNKDQQRYQDLSVEFEFVSSLQQLEDQKHAKQQQRDRVMADIRNAEQQPSLDSINRSIAKASQERDQLQKQLASLNNNLYLQLQQLLPADSVDFLNRLLATSVLSLPVADHAPVQLHDAASFQAFADQMTAHLTAQRLQLPGLSIDLATLPPNLTLKSAQQLIEEIADCEQQLQNWLQLQHTVTTLVQQKQQQQALEQEIAGLAKDIMHYQELLTLKAGLSARLEQLAASQQQIAAYNQEEATLTQQKEHIRQQQTDVKKHQAVLQSQHERINKARNQRQDHQELFVQLAELPRLPCMDNTDLAMPELADRIENYNSDCLRLKQLHSELDKHLQDLHRDGIDKFQAQDSREQELDALFAYTDNLSQEQAAIARKARSAVVQVAAILRDLRGSLELFKRRMHEFNKKINKRQLSDLKVFKIEPREEDVLVQAINTLISTSEQVESGHSFDLFDHHSVLDDKTLTKAKDTLIKQGEIHGGLRVEHLFRLVFIIAKEGQVAAEFEDIDSAASNGTVLMAKLITGLAMLNQMQDPRKAIKTACYLDEAASLDQRNQRNLIAIAAEFGFTLIFASPEPQITARYCVPISTAQGKNYISRRNWQILESLAEASDTSPT